MDPAQRRAQLLDVAKAYFDAHGIDVSLEAVARAAGISPPLMRRYFGTRDGLLLELVTSRLPDLPELFADPGTDVREQIGAYLRWIEPSPWAHEVWMAAVNDPARDPQLRDGILATRRWLIERAAGRPLGPEEHNLRARAEAFIAAFEAAISAWLIRHEPSREVLIDDLVDIARRLGITR